MTVGFCGLSDGGMASGMRGSAAGSMMSSTAVVYTIVGVGIESCRMEGISM